jgi:hypothetical protein
MTMKSALVLALIASLTMPSASLAAPQTATLSDVLSLTPGTEVTLWTSRSGGDRRYFIRADDDAIALLNLSDSKMPSSVAKLLRRQITEHPEYFPMPAGTTIALDNQASLGTSGLVVAGRKIAEYDQVVERIPRIDVQLGAASLEVKTGWSLSKQILATVGAAFAAGAAIVVIGCMTQRCD